MMNTQNQNPFKILPPGFLRCFLVPVLALLVSATAMAGVLEGRVVAVTDGDTIKVLDTANFEHVIRLAGIDAPEKRMPFGQRSKQNLSDLVYGKRAVVEGQKKKP